MTREDVAKIQDASRTVKALEFILDRSIKTGRQQTAMIARREIERIKVEILLKYDIRL
jgi:hypothetical protein